ncbi:NAD-dependent epimerase/dehydratase family protein [Bacillus sp. S34]|nr:NAD-dependent epimerase/dehydratase family protein [Bacillus sp. S34]
MDKKPTLLITGASGFTGLHACDYFSRLEFDVIAITNMNSFSNKQIKRRTCNLSNNESVKDLISITKPDYLLHLAGQNAVGLSWDNPIQSLEVNAMATAYLLDALRKEMPSCKAVIVGSALQFDPTVPATFNHPYGLSKTIQTLISQFWSNQYNMNVVVAKPSNLIGPGFSKGVCSIFAKKIIAMEKEEGEKYLRVSNLNNRFDFLDVRDAVRAYDFLLRKGENGRSYNVSSGKSNSLQDIINIFKKITPIKFQVKVDDKSPLNNFVTSNPTALTDLGWQPTTTLESSIRDIIDFYR